VKHFLVIDVIVTIILISAYVRCYEFYPNFLPFYLIDTLIRFYSAFCTFSLYIKYREAQRATPKPPKKILIEEDSILVLPVQTKPPRPGGDGVLRIFDTFLCFVRLEIAGFLYAGLNIICSILIMLYLIVYLPMKRSEDGGEGGLGVLDIIIYVIAFLVNFAMTLSFLVGIKMVSLEVTLFR
jgi:hypothetical protein